MAKSPVFIKQRHGNAVHFRLDYDRNLLVREEPRDARIEICDFLLGVSVVEAKHWRPMRNLRERFQRFSTHALRRRIWRHELRELCFKIDKLLVEPVVIAVADYRRGFL